jgi:hypothetical protein
MQVRSLDANNDWIFGIGRQAYRQEKDALRQKISTRLLSWKGDCFFALAEGVDWNNYLDIGTKKLLDIDISRVINTTDGIISARDYKSYINANRTLSVAMVVRTIYGNIAISEVQNA